MPRAFRAWAAAASVCGMVGLAALITDVVHDLSQSIGGVGGLDPPIDATIGEAAFLAAAIIAAGLADYSRRVRHRSRTAPTAARRRQRLFTHAAVACVVAAAVTAAID